MFIISIDAASAKYFNQFDYLLLMLEPSDRATRCRNFRRAVRKTRLWAMFSCWYDHPI